MKYRSTTWSLSVTFFWLLVLSTPNTKLRMIVSRRSAPLADIYFSEAANSYLPSRKTLTFNSSLAFLCHVEKALYSTISIFFPVVLSRTEVTHCFYSAHVLMHFHSIKPFVF
jgi:hypothetical protein